MSKTRQQLEQEAIEAIICACLLGYGAAFWRKVYMKIDAMKKKKKKNRY